jgi:hypothetical protein
MFASHPPNGIGREERMGTDLKVRSQPWSGTERYDEDSDKK